MIYKAVEKGYKIEVGDLIQHENNFQKTKYLVNRVTPKYAFVKWNDHVEGKFPRIYDDWSFEPFPKAQWRTSSYRVFKKATP